MKNKFWVSFTFAVTFATISGPVVADAQRTVDWEAIPGTKIMLFYPGQSSYEWLRTKHKGADDILEGQECLYCHQGEEKEKGKKIVKGDPIEPTPVAGKNGSVELNVKVAYDSRNAYFRFQWKTQNSYPGIEHQYLRFDGKEWTLYGKQKLEVAAQDKEPAIYEDDLAMMIDDGKVPLFAAQGCWLTCHQGEPNMPEAATRDAVQVNPLMKSIGKDEVHKYLPATRNDPGDWRTGKSTEQIAHLKTGGGFLDLMQWHAYRSHMGTAGDGYVFEYRYSDLGTGAFASNVDINTRLPKYMWDSGKTGYRSINESQLRQGEHFLIDGQNTVPFDSKAGWKPGDMVPYYYLSQDVANDNRARSRASWTDGTWTVEISRPLDFANGDSKVLRPGGHYSVGFAVHDDNIAGRGHFVSFPRTLGFGTKADIQAVLLP